MATAHAPLGRLPASLVIGPYDIPVRPLPAVEGAAQDVDGRYVATQQAIDIRVDLTEEAANETLLHEALHALWDQLDLPKADEETIIARLSPQLLALFRHNPALGRLFFR
jgi:hypothetical protein